GVWVGGSGQTGLAVVRNGAGKNTVNLGGGDTGDLSLCNKDGNSTVALRAVENTVAGIWVGGSGQTGDLYLRNKDGNFTGALRAVENNTAGLWVGGQGQSGLIVVRNSAGTDTVVLDGEAGDLSLLGADCAEEFDIVETDQIDAGCVVVLAPDGRLRVSTQP